MNKKVLVLGGGTFSHVRAHLALAAPAFGTTARQIAEMCEKRFDHMDTELLLTKMADQNSSVITNDDVDKVVDIIINDNTVKIVFFNFALCDFSGKIGDVESGKHATRLETSAGDVQMTLTPSEKIIGKIRKTRKDIFLVGFKTTCGATEQEQFSKGLDLMKKTSCNIVLANDIETRKNLIITPEEGVYGRDMTRKECLEELVDIAAKRSSLTFNDKTILKNAERAYPENLIIEGSIPENWYNVMKYLFSNNAFKPINGKTSGHFGCRVDGKEFERITSERKINHNESFERGMIPVYSYENGELVVGGAKPSVGEKTQEMIYQELGYKIHSIVHFHGQIRKDIVYIPFEIKDQKPFECGSKECAINTISGMSEVIPGIYAVHLDNHGPNIAFHKDVSSQEIIEFINLYWDLNSSTSGFNNINNKESIEA